MVSDASIKKIKPKDFYIDKLPAATRRAFLYCTKLRFLSRSSWYLAGGTALALQVGHRQSVDLDFFTPQKSFRGTAFERQLFATGQWVTSFRQEGTIYGVLLKTRISLIAYPFFIPSLPKIHYGNVKILASGDIAAMKIVAISQRGRKRDFVDLYWYCLNREPLYEVIKRAMKQYPGQEHNVNHILRSLVYFDDADQDPMPKIFFKATWREIKKFFQREVPKITRDFLGLK